ncbi:MAG: hypothetical protein Q8Q92_05080 [bacterium]|nr:hypothetical protein [bacterium]
MKGPPRDPMPPFLSEEAGDDGGRNGGGPDYNRHRPETNGHKCSKTDRYAEKHADFCRS